MKHHRHFYKREGVMKVYCKDCKYYRGERYHSLNGFCESYSGGNAYTEVKNKLGTCFDYKRKWWKFWVKS